MSRGKAFKAILRKVAVAVVPTLFFGLAALISPLGYTLETHVYSIDKHYELMGRDYVFAVVSFNSTGFFNPFLYPISWLASKGAVSGNFTMIYLPYWQTGVTPQGEQYYYETWGKPKVIEGEATMKLVLEEFLVNVPILPALFIAVELACWRKFYLLFIGGTLGFAFGTLVGAVVGFFLGAFSSVVLLPMLNSRMRAKDTEPAQNPTDI